MTKQQSLDKYYRDLGAYANMIEQAHKEGHHTWVKELQQTLGMIINNIKAIEMELYTNESEKKIPAILANAK